MSTTHFRSFPSRLYRALKHSRGAVMAEYMPVLFLVPIIASAGFQLYGGTLRAQLGQMADQIASNYYQGWFYPVIRPLTPGGTGTGSSNGGGGPLADNPLYPSDSDGNPIFPDGPTWGGGNTGDPDLPGGGGGGGQQCGASSTGFSSSPVSSAAPTNTVVANPIDLGNGNKFQQESDYRHFNPTPLVFERYYNSLQSNIALSLGHGWRHSYQRQIRFPDSDRAELNALTMVRDDGTVYLFTRQGEHWLATGVVDQLEESAEGWLYTTVYGYREIYNKQGTLQAIHYTSGVEHRLDYTDGQLTQISDSRGPSIRLHYSDHWLTRVELPNQQVLRYRYSEQGNLAAFQRLANSTLSQLRGVFDDNTSTYHYENSRFQHGLTGITDAEGRRFATWGYDRLGRANLSEHGQGTERFTIEYRSDNSVAMTNAAGLITIYHLEEARPGYRRLVSVEGLATPTCPQVRKDHRYNEQGFLKLAIDAEGHALKMKRNDRGLIEEQQDGLILQQGEWLPVQGSVRTERSWHPMLPLVTQEIVSSFQQGEWQSYRQADIEYSDAGRLLKRTYTDLSQQIEPYSTYGNQRSWTYDYTVSDVHANQLVSMSVNGPRQARADGSDDIVTRYFNQQGLLESIVNPLGHTTAITAYSKSGQPTQAVLDNGLKLLLEYDERDNLTQLTRYNSTQSEIYQASYDRNDLIQQLTLPDGSWQRFSYNAARQLTEITNIWGDTLVVVPSTVSGQWTEQTIYNVSGQVVRQSSRSLDSLGRVIKLLGQYGQETHLSYTKAGQLGAVQELGASQPHRQYYDSLNRLSQSVNALQGSIQIDYSLQGPVSLVIDAEGSQTEYKYNGFGEVIWQRSDAAGESILYLDTVGNVIAMTSADSTSKHKVATTRQIQHHYDVLNRLIRVDYPGDANDITYQYDQVDALHGNGLGKLTAVDDSSGISDYQYNDFGRLIADQRAADTSSIKSEGGDHKSAPEVIRYQYQTGGQLASISYPNGDQVRYHYNKNRLSNMDYHTAGGKKYTLIGEFEYQAFAAPKAWRYGNGLSYQQSFDLSGRVEAITLKDSSNNTLWSQQYQHDQRNNIIAVAQQTARQTITNRQYGYDDLHRLTDEAYPDNDERNSAYRYDGVGNRTQKVTPADQLDYRYEAGSRLLGYGAITIKRDGRGNALQVLSGDTNTNTRFVYDYQNKPIAYFEQNKLKASYRYNAFRQRTEKQLPSTYRQYRYNPSGQLIAEKSIDKRTSEVSKTINYLWLGQVPIAQVTSEDGNVSVAYLHVDHLNTARVATNDNQQIIWQWESDAFGVGEANEDPDGNDQLTHINLRFPGQYYDKESGLYYNYHRYYDPGVGRYIQSDPIGLDGGINTFAYVRGNPVMRVDPLGLYDAAIHYYMTYFLAITAGLSEDQSLIIATAAQYVDDNPLTSPLPTWSSPAFVEALETYHFTLDYENGSGGDSSGRRSGESAEAYARRRFQNPGSQQLDRLRGAADLYANVCRFPGGATSEETRAQLYGEYLHALEDTYAHRNRNNVPLSIYNSEGVLGHAAFGHSPDHTYNQMTITDPHHTQPGANPTHDEWAYNELRTLEMERQVFENLQKDFGTTPRFTWEDLAGAGDARIGIMDYGSCDTCWTNGVAPTFEAAEGVTRILQQFNEYNDGGTEDGIIDKKEILDEWLGKRGLNPIPLYDEDSGENNRDRILEGVPDIAGIMLP